MRKIFADISRALNLSCGGPYGKTLCWRIAMRWGDDCLFCRVIGWVMHERWHCYDELDAADLMARMKGKRK